MANMCYNTVQFSGENADKALELFRGLMNATEGVLPDFIKDGRYFFDVSEYGERIILFTKWAPPIEEMLRIGRELKVDYVMEYEELGSYEYGKFRYNAAADLYSHTYLTPEDFNLFIKEDSGICLYKGEWYECEEDVLLLLLNAKELTND